MLATDFAADDLNKRGITTVNGLGGRPFKSSAPAGVFDLRWPYPGGLFFGVKNSASGRDSEYPLQQPASMIRIRIRARLRELLSHWHYRPVPCCRSVLDGDYQKFMKWWVR